MSRWMAILGAGVLACGGGDSNDPGDPFPGAAGTYAMTGGFDDVPSTVASFTGTLTLTQATQESGELGGSAQIVAQINGETFNVADPVLGAASVSATGTVAFTMADPSGSWTFTGELSGTNIARGRHTLNGGTSGTFSGDWSANRQSSVRADLKPSQQEASHAVAGILAGLRGPARH
jgi:hypothetical protein